MSSADQPHQRILTDTAFGDDDGLADPATRRALADVRTGDGPEPYLRAVVRLCTDRLLVPVVATRTKEGIGAAGVVSDKEAEMAVVLLQTADGRRGMLAFSGLDALAAWNEGARPVPVTLDLAARSAIDDGAAALLIDLAGPHPLVIDGEVLDHLAAGHRLVEADGGQFGWAMADSGPAHDR